jgi:hypothetical protein
MDFSKPGFAIGRAALIALAHASATCTPPPTSPTVPFLGEWPDFQVSVCAHAHAALNRSAWTQPFGDGTLHR